MLLQNYVFGGGGKREYELVPRATGDAELYVRRYSKSLHKSDDILLISLVLIQPIYKEAISR